MNEEEQKLEYLREERDKLVFAKDKIDLEINDILLEDNNAN